MVIAIWFGLATLSRNIVVKVFLGWVGLAGVALYWRWAHKEQNRAAEVGKLTALQETGCLIGLLR